MTKGSFVEKCIIEMIYYIDRLTELNMRVVAEPTLVLVLQSLPDNYEMTLRELLTMLREIKPKAKRSVLLVEGPMRCNESSRVRKPRGNVLLLRYLEESRRPKPNRVEGCDLFPIYRVLGNGTARNTL